ncbi:universal stress protein [Verrucomicrobiales bacterium BCK34]|nr:universal stress protein [Verrucomicrobiales bacterium BCK34]
MEKPIKRILVPLDPSMYADAATKTACRIAKEHGAEVGGVAVLDSSEITSSLVPKVGPYYPMMLEAVQKKKQHAGHILEDCLARFAATCEEEGVKHFETKWEGLPVKKLLASSIFYDLIVIGLETFFHFETRGEDEDNGQSLEEILDQTITPVIAVPASGLANFNRTLITFDGSLASARALQDFSKFAQPFDFEITIFVAGKPKEEADFLLTEATEFLGAHGLKKVTTREELQPIETSLSPDFIESFDLVVAGIHSRRAIKDFFVGSFAKNLIQKGTKPLFLSH